MIHRAQQFKDQLLRISLGIIYLWFGALKFIPGASPAESLAKETVHLLTFGLVPDPAAFTLLAAWEVLIGVLLILKFNMRTAIRLALVHMIFTFAPLILLPSLAFQEHFYSLTLVGQYIVKNLVIVSALLFLYPEKEKPVRAKSKASTRPLILESEHAHS